MKSVVCTLFEGMYHLGVGAFINSLHSNGFAGDVYVGYRGELPEWTSKAVLNDTLGWSGVRTMHLDEGLTIHFLPVSTAFHFTNYKPTFMLDLWNGPAREANNLFYFDPDIVNKCAWSFYERWVQFGVALVHEIVSNDMPANHPRRMQWKSVATAAGYKVKNNLSSYINAGFVGVHKTQIAFLQEWKHLIDFSIANFNLDQSKFNQSDSNVAILNIADQDLLNLTAMCTEQPLSEMGPEGMDFANGGWVMSHATGSPKPWKKNFLSLALKGKVPSLPDKLYWQNCTYPIRLFTKNYIYRKHVSAKIASFIGRFYRQQ